MQINVGLADVIRISPMIAIFIASLLPITTKVLSGNKEPNNLVTLIQGIAGLIIGLVLLTVVAGSGELAFSKSLVFDSVTLWMGSLAILSATGAIIMMYENYATNGRQFAELIFLALNSVVLVFVINKMIHA